MENSIKEDDENIQPIDFQTLERNAQIFNVWRDEYDKIMLSWRKLAAINMWLSQASKYKYDRINNWLAYPSIILSVVMSIGIVGIDTCNTQIGTYIIAFITLVSGILTTINKHMGAAEKAHEFYVRAKEYYSLIREIDYVVSLNKNDRPEPYETMIRLRADLEKIINNQLDFPIAIVRDYERKFRSLESSLFVDLESERKLNEPVNINIPENDKISSINESETKKHTLIPFLSIIKENQSYKGNNKNSKRISQTLLSPYQLHIVSPFSNTPPRKSTDTNPDTSSQDTATNVTTRKNKFMIPTLNKETDSQSSY